MSQHIVMGIILFACALTGIIAANIFLMMMIGEINRKRQEGSLISYFGFAFPKMVRIFSAYRKLYPRGKLHIYALSAFSIAIVGLGGVAVCLGILG